jgi:hypothetical protein
VTPDWVIPLFDKYVFSQDAYPKKKPKAQVNRECQVAKNYAIGIITGEIGVHRNRVPLMKTSSTAGITLAVLTVERLSIPMSDRLPFPP